MDRWGNRELLSRPPAVRRSVPALFAEQAARVPHAVAISFNGRELTYRELDQASDQLAHRLIAQGVRPGESVALLTERCPEAVVAMLAVLKTGAAYLPIDPALPDVRVEFMIGDAAPAAAITTADLTDRLAGYALTVIDVGDTARAPIPVRGPRYRCRAQTISPTSSTRPARPGCRRVWLSHITMSLR